MADKELTEKQIKFLTAYEENPGKSLKALCQVAGYAETTNPVTVAKILRKEIREILETRMARLGHKALDALESVMDDPTQLGANTKLRAASIVADKLLASAKDKEEVERKMPNAVILLPVANSNPPVNDFKIINSDSLHNN